jgi:hypothetical protein
MKTILTLAGLLLLIILLSKLAKKFLSDVFNEKDKLDMEQDDIYFVPPIEIVDEKIVLSVENDSSSSNPRRRKDYNDKQNLNTKYNKNTYRSKNGRYRSLTEIV